MVYTYKIRLFCDYQKWTSSHLASRRLFMITARMLILIFGTIKILDAVLLTKILHQVASYVHINRTGMNGDSHVYSLLYQFEDFIHPKSWFPDDMFNKVVPLIILDAFPFEHTWFKIVSESFSQLKHWVVRNDHPQGKTHGSLILNVFSHRIFLDLLGAHVSDAEQLLHNTNSILPRLQELHIRYKSLRTITNNFTIDGTCLNFSKLRKLNLNKEIVLPENFPQYFPLI